MQVLLVDGNARLRRLLTSHIGGVNHRVDSVATTAAARLTLLRRPYDLMLLDLLAPGSDGLDLIRLVRSRGLAMPVLIGTDIADLDRHIAALEAGADAVLVRPYRDDELLARVRALLRRPAGSLSARAYPSVARVA